MKIATWMHEKTVKGGCQMNGWSSWMRTMEEWGQMRLGTPSVGGGGGTWRCGLLALESEPAGSVSAALPSAVVWLRRSTQVSPGATKTVCHLTTWWEHHMLWWRWKDQNRFVKAAFFKGSASEHRFSTTWLCLNNIYSFGNMVKYKVHQGADKNLAFQK